MKYYADKARHLVCVPYTVENLHAMAAELGIKRYWFHSGARWQHYDIPKRRIEDILVDPRVDVVTSKELLRLISR